MDPIIISIVGALASGALVVAAKGLATEAVKDAYTALKKLVVDRYHKAGPFVDEVEADPRVQGHAEGPGQAVDRRRARYRREGRRGRAARRTRARGSAVCLRWPR